MSFKCLIIVVFVLCILTKLVYACIPVDSNTDGVMRGVWCLNHGPSINPLLMMSTHCS